jgi:hypothetical protein
MKNALNRPFILSEPASPGKPLPLSPVVQLNRRTFVKTTATIASLTALSASRVLGANERVGVGIIGFGLIGRIHARSFMSHPDVEIVAVADAYRPRVEEGVALAGPRASLPGTPRSSRSLATPKPISSWCGPTVGRGTRNCER